MKFLVLALCVCAASAASFGSTPFGGGFKNYKGFQNTAASAVVAPAAFAAKTAAVAAAPVVAPVAAAAEATYQAGNAVYQGAKSVVNKAYSDEAQAAVLRSESDVSSDGYKYTFETSNGINAEVVGSYRQVGEAGGVVSQGSYRYTAPDGTPVFVTYVADENGYQPSSDILPVGPAIPEAIARSLDYIAAHTKDAAQKY